MGKVGGEMKEEAARYGTVAGVYIDGVIVASIRRGPVIQNQRRNL